MNDVTSSRDADAPGYEVVDPRPIRAENPQSFFVPCRERLDALAVDDAVKAIFEPRTGAGTGEPATERMWLRITAVEGEDLTAILQNSPLSSASMDLQHGDVVRLKRHHVIDIETTRADDPAETNSNDQWFRRCRIDARIDAGAPIVRIARDEPPGDLADDIGVRRFGWSGWRFEAAGYQPGMKTEVYALVVPLRREVGYEHLLDAPPGSVIERGPDGFALI